MAIPPSQVVLNSLVSSEVATWGRQRAAESVSAIQIEELIDRVAKELKKSTTNSTESFATTTSTPLPSLGDICGSIASGTVNATRKLYSTVTSGIASLVSSSQENGMKSSSSVPPPASISNGVFNPNQDFFLSGLISSLHRDHLANLSEAQKQVLMVCGVTAAASIGVTALTWYLLSKKQQQQQVVENSTSSSSSKVLKIKNLNFEGTAEEFVQFMEKVQQQNNNANNQKKGKKNGKTVTPLAIEIENACIVSNKNQNSNENEDEDMYSTDSLFGQEVFVRPPTPPLRSFNVYEDDEQ